MQREELHRRLLAQIERLTPADREALRQRLLGRDVDADLPISAWAAGLEGDPASPLDRELRDLLEDGAIRASLVDAASSQRFTVAAGLRQWFARPRGRVLSVLLAVALAGVAGRTLLTPRPSAAPVQFHVLLRSPDGAFLAVPQDHLFDAGDQVRLRVEPPERGTLRVTSASGAVLFEGTAGPGAAAIVDVGFPGQTFTLTVETAAGTRSAEVRLRSR